MEPNIFTEYQGQPQAMDTCAERFDHFGFDFEFNTNLARKRTCDLFEDSLDYLRQTPIAHEPRVAEGNCLEADFFDDESLPGQLDDIFDTPELLAVAQTAISTPVIDQKFENRQTEDFNQFSPESATNALQGPYARIDKKVNVVEESDREPQFCMALRYPEQPQRQEVNRVARTSRRIQRDNKQGTSGSFICAHCGMTFEQSVSLGGHISRAHPGRSSDYQQKLQTRQKREPLRRSLAWAKEQCRGMNVNSEYRRRIKRLRQEYLSRHQL